MESSNINSYVWKDRRLTSDRKEKQMGYQMVNMSEYELQQAYNHCKTMLYNNDPTNLGRMLVLDLISEQLDRCGAELALRWFKTLVDDKGNIKYSSDGLMQELREWVSLCPADPDKTLRLQDFVEVHPDYKAVPIDLLMKACRDDLGYFDSSRISLSFIYRQGIYFTHDELKDMSTFTMGNTLKEKFEVLKYQLNLSDDVELKANPNGFTEQQFRDLIHLKKYKGYHTLKYSELTTSQLQTLRKKVLFKLEDEVLFQINIWNTLMKQIKEVAEYKHYIITE